VLSSATPAPTGASSSSFHVIKVTDNNGYITLNIDGISYDIEKDTSNEVEELSETGGDN